MLNPKRLYNIALFYLKRYDSSSFNLRKVLKRRVLKEQIKNNEIPENINEIIEDIIKKVISLGYVNDKRFLENEVRRLMSKGKSRSYIEQKLMLNGYKSDDFKEFLNEKIEDEIDMVVKFIKKHKLFNDEARKQKDLAKILRAGFKYDDIKQALNIIKNEE